MSPLNKSLKWAKMGCMEPEGGPVPCVLQCRSSGGDSEDPLCLRGDFVSTRGPWAEIQAIRKHSGLSTVILLNTFSNIALRPPGPCSNKRQPAFLSPGLLWLSDDAESQHRLTALATRALPFSKSSASLRPKPSRGWLPFTRGPLRVVAQGGFRSFQDSEAVTRRGVEIFFTEIPQGVATTDKKRFLTTPRDERPWSVNNERSNETWWVRECFAMLVAL